jgi:hypothetical protein
MLSHLDHKNVIRSISVNKTLYRNANRVQPHFTANQGAKAMSTQTIKNRYTGVVLKSVEADSLSGADLSGADLGGADLSGADLCGADLSGADLCGANLGDADLRRAVLCGAAWERITEYGKLYTWGRGGRTLAPYRLVKGRGRTRFSMREGAPDELPVNEVVEMIRIVESFNAYVTDWNKAENLQYMFDEDNLADANEAAAAALEICTD